MCVCVCDACTWLRGCLPMSVCRPFEIPYAEYESLSSVQEITGCLVIDGASTPDLAFLRNLKSVGSCIGTSYQAYYLSFSISVSFR